MLSHPRTRAIQSDNCPVSSWSMVKLYSNFESSLMNQPPAFQKTAARRHVQEGDVLGGLVTLANVVPPRLRYAAAVVAHAGRAQPLRLEVPPLLGTIWNGLSGSGLSTGTTLGEIERRNRELCTLRPKIPALAV